MCVIRHQSGKKFGEYKILEILKNADDYFTPPISARINLNILSNKFKSNAQIFISTVENKDVGYLFCYINSAPVDSYLSLYFINPEYRGLKIAYKLLHAMIALCKTNGSKYILCETNKGNIASIKALETVGFISYEEYFHEAVGEKIKLKYTIH